MHAVSRLVAFTTAVSSVALCTAATVPRATPGVSLPQQPTQAATQSGPSRSQVWNIILAVTQVVTQIIEAIISAGGWGGTSDQNEMVAALTVAPQVAAEESATITVIQNLPGMLDCQQFPLMIAGFQQQNAAAGKPLPNQLTVAQIQLLTQRIQIISVSNPRLANDLKVLVGRLPRS